MNRASLPLLFLLAGCDGCEPGTDVPDVLDPIPADAAALWMGQGSGVGGAHVPALLVNEVGGVVPAGEVSFVSGGALTAASAVPDAFGYAWAEVTSTVPGAWDIAGTASTFTATGTAFVTAAPDAPTAFSAWLSAGQGTWVAHAGAGVVNAKGNELWWTATDGGAPIRVLALTDTIAGVRSTELDSDGVTDVLVWSSDEAVVLRGRGEGGLAFAAGWRPKSGTVRGFATALLNDDTRPDVLLVTGDADSTTVLWLESDGDGGWEAKAALEQDYASFGVSGEDLDDDGYAEVTLLTADGLLRRFSWTPEDDAWQAATTADSTLGIAEGAQVFGGHDFNGDLLDEVLVVGPLSDGTGYAADAMDGASRGGLIYNLTGNLAGVTELGAGVADADADGSPDIFLSTPTALYRGGWNSQMGQFMLDNYGALPASASIDPGDLDGDGLVDLLVSRAATVALRGTSVADDPDTEDDESVPWKVATPFSGLFDIGLGADPWVGDFNGDDLVDIVSFVDNGNPAIQAFYGVAETDGASENLRAARSMALLATDIPLDITVCGTRVWALLTTTTGTVTRAYSIDGFGVLTLASSIETDGGVQIACGNFAAGEAAVTDDAGNAMWVSVGTPDVVEAGYGPWGDIAAADRDGDGVDELVGCRGDCTIAAADFDGDSLDDVAWADSTDTIVSIGGLETSLGFPGAVWAGDADGDAVADIVVQSDGVLAVWRGLGGRVGVPWASYIARHTRGRGFTGDLDGNGVPDPFWLGDERVADDNADWTGTLLYAEAPDLPTP